jgi:capsular exopolysaccharide synthesis family protein
MTVAEYVGLFRQRWILVTLVATLSLVASCGYVFLVPPTYQSQIQLFVSTSDQTTDVADLTQGGTFVQQRVKSYAQIIASPRVLQPVIDQLKLGTTADDLAQHMAASNPLDTVLLDVSVTDTSPQRASDTANAVAKTFPGLVNELETPRGKTASPVKVSVTRFAVPPSHPVSPRKKLDVSLGLLVGLVLGLGAALLREALDRTIGGRNSATAVVRAPVLGTVADEGQLANRSLITHDAFSSRAEAFRQLRTNIRFLGVDNSIRSFVVTGSVEAEGKSTTAANLAIALAQAGENVVLIDADLRRPSIADIFGLPAGVGLTSVLLGDAPLEGALQRWRDDLPLRVLTSGPLPPNPSELIGSAHMADTVRALTSAGVTVVLDSPPLLPVTDGAVMAKVTDGALLVVRVGSTKVEQLAAAAEALRTAHAPILGLVLNRVPKKGGTGAYPGGYHTYAAGSADPVAAAAPAQLATPLALQVATAPEPAPPLSAPPLSAPPRTAPVPELRAAADEDGWPLRGLAGHPPRVTGSARARGRRANPTEP